MRPDTAMNIPFDPAHVDVLGSITVDRRSFASGLSHITAGFAEWIAGEVMEPWVLPYEEALYVISGELTIVADGKTIVGRPGDMITCEKGTTQVATAIPGTRVFFASYPRDWRETSDLPTVKR
jgi:ethanolamine utilization protein EutQ